MNTQKIVSQPRPTTQEYREVDAAFKALAHYILRHFDGYEMVSYMNALDKAMLPDLPADQLVRIKALESEIEAGADAVIAAGTVA